MKIIVGVLLLLSSRAILAADNKNILYNAIDKLEQALLKLGVPSSGEKPVKVGIDDIPIPNIKFGRVGQANDGDALKKFIQKLGKEDVHASLYIINTKVQLIPITTTALDFRGARQIGKMNSLEINNDLMKVIKNKSKICAEKLVVPTKGMAYQSDNNNSLIIENLEEKLKKLRDESFQSKTFLQEEKDLLTEIRNLNENPSRCKVFFDYCAKPILSSSGKVLGVYFVQEKSKNNSKCSEKKYPVTWQDSGSQ